MNPLMLSAARRRKLHLKKTYPNSGPGASELASGDETIGYFGEVAGSAFITGAQLASLIGSMPGTPINSGGGWLKFMRGGKPLFVAKLPYARSISWNDLNSKNILTGARTLVIGGKSYKIRVMTGGDKNPYTAAGGEWNDLMYAVSAGRPAGYAGLRAAEFSETALGIGSVANPMRTLCLETSASASANCMTRGRENTAWFGGLQKTDNGTLVYWRPVLEPV